MSFEWVSMLVRCEMDDGSGFANRRVEFSFFGLRLLRLLVQVDYAVSQDRRTRDWIHFAIRSLVRVLNQHLGVGSQRGTGFALIWR